LGVGEAVGCLREEAWGGGADALALAAEAGQVEVGLEDLVLGPGALEREGEPHLLPLLAECPGAGGTERRVEQRGDLHGDRAGAAAAASGEALDERSGGRAQVGAALSRARP